MPLGGAPKSPWPPPAVRGRLQGEEGAGLVHGGTQRGGADVQADQVEQVAMLAGRGIGPFTAPARRRKAHEERAAHAAAGVAGGPVIALPAAPGQVAPADVFGTRSQGGGEPGGVHGVRSRAGAPARFEGHGEALLPVAGRPPSGPPLPPGGAGRAWRAAPGACVAGALYLPEPGTLGTPGSKRTAKKGPVPRQLAGTGPAEMAGGRKPA